LIYGLNNLFRNLLNPFKNDELLDKPLDRLEKIIPSSLEAMIDVRLDRSRIRQQPETNQYYPCYSHSRVAVK